MKKRKFKNLDFIILAWIIFVLFCTALPLIFYKEEPIPLTDTEINYYSNQAELAYYEGIICLDNNVEFINNHDGSYDIYGYNQPLQKQKLTVTFLEGGTLDLHPYYDYDFLDTRILIASFAAILSFALFVPITCLLLTIFGAILKLIDFFKLKS